MKWEPSEHHSDPIVNAILNVAESVSALAQAADGLNYALKYSKTEGLSVAEALIESSEKISDSVRELATELVDLADRNASKD